jgi:Mce-associated membrane protein
VADARDREQESAKAKADATALAEQAEAEAAAADALAAAARARARAIRLRQEAQAHAKAQAAEESREPTAVADDTEAAAETPEAVEKSEPSEALEQSESIEPSEPAQGRFRAPGLILVLAAAALVAILGPLALTGWLLWHHHGVEQERQRSAAFVAAAKQGVINLTSMDFNKSKEDIQRVLDSSTGQFRDDFQRRAGDFASVVKDAKAVTEGSVAATAVESVQKDSAVVLVVGNERVSNAAGAKDEPRTFRFRVSVVKEGDQLKISKVEFVV